MTQPEKSADKIATSTAAPKPVLDSGNVPSIFSPKVAAAGALVAACTVAAFIFVPSLVRLSYRSTPLSPDRFDYAVFLARMNTILLGLVLSVWLLVPSLECAAQWLRERWRTAYTAAALLATCGFLSLFIIHYGNQQFGSWDMGIIVDTGWRQILGQRQYTDFITPNPPGFNLGIKYAFQLFGVNWNAQLYLLAIFASATFLWAYWLLLRLLGSRLSALSMAFAIQCVAILPLCFWWYNDIVAVLAALFFLSCLLYSKQPDSPTAQLSYFATLSILVLMKPNTAGLTAICGIAFLIVSIRPRRRFALLTLAAAAATFLILQFNKISIPAMIASYRAVAIERGGFSRFGLVGLTRADEIKLLTWTLVAAAPLLALIGPTLRQMRNRQWRTVALYLFLAATLPITLYGMASDGENKLVECGMLLAAGAVAAFGLRLSGPNLRRLFVATVFALSVCGIYMGAIRIRVYGLSPHRFFEWRTGNHPVPDKFFRDTYASPLMLNVLREVKAVKSADPGPYFFGPGMEFNYAVFAIPSPSHLPVYWQAGTSFARRDEPRLLELWKQHHFNTLIYMKDDYAFYSPAMISLLAAQYQKDDSFPDITVYHARH